jgi:CHAT domain-containing protein
MRIRAKVAGVLMTGGLAAAVQQPTLTSARLDVTVTTIDDARPIERSLAPGDDHRYAIALGADEYVKLLVAHHHVEAAVDTYDADGRPLAHYEDDLRIDGEDQVEVVSDAAGAYGVAVHGAPGVPSAGSYVVRVVARRPASAGDTALQSARQLRMRAGRHLRDGRFVEARECLERALAVVERERGADHLDAAATAAELAEAYRHLPDDARAQQLYERAIATMARRLDEGDPRIAVMRGHLAQLQENMGNRAAAEALLNESLRAIEQALGTDNRWYVGGLVTQARLRGEGADDEGEEATLRRAMSIEERIGDSHSLNYAAILNNLGEVYRRRGDFARAQTAYEGALKIGAETIGADGYLLATSLQNLGIVARERKDYPAALEYYQRALSIRERAVGADHPDVAQLLLNTANIYRAKGDTSDALAMQFRALDIWEHSAGPYREATLIAVGNIARTYAAAGAIESAIAFQRRADTIVEKELELNLAVGSERQKLAFVNAIAERTDRTISLHLLEAPASAHAAELAALVILQRKGRVQDAMIDTFAAGRRRLLEPHDVALLDELKSTTSDLARVALTADVKSRRAEPAAIARLEARKEQLEAELSAHSAALRAEMQPVTVAAVQAEIPRDAALVEFAVFRPFNPRAERNAEAYGPSHYAAFVLRREAPPQGVDLGLADTIDGAVDVLRDALRDPHRADVKVLARIVNECVMQPIEAAIGNATRLLVSPDGDLNLVPFEAMVDSHGRYLLERYAVSYVTSGRDLLRMRVARESRGGPAVFADPLFGEPVKRQDLPGAGETPGMYFAPLPASAVEARTIKALFPETTIFSGARATKAALQALEAPRMLHIAAHGFFVGDGRSRTSNPLLRSGLAFAGANLLAARDRAILTALEASSLNLWGTKLVTLSACDTGVGDVRNGEGVYGLRRAFVLAGTETLVMTLWPVGDAIARETMVSYYTELRSGLGRGDALRQSKLAILAKPNRSHPYYWAGFIQSGEWASLEGTR